jgi:hypothetical protein
MRRRLPRLAVAIALLAVSPGASVRADEAKDPWEDGAARWFASGRLDLGTFEHLGLAAGYGKPHWMWGGVEAHGILGLDFGAVAANLRLALLVGDLWAGLRATHAWEHVPMPEQPHYDAVAKAGGFTYRTLDLFASGLLPTPGGLVLWEANFVRFLDAPAGAIYEEWLRVVCVPPWCGVARLGWVARLRDGALHVGLGGEWAFLDGRSGEELVRLGPILTWRIWPHLALQGYVYFPVSDPDRLAFLDRVNATLILSFTIATGSPPPRFP